MSNASRVLLAAVATGALLPLTSIPASAEAPTVVRSNGTVASGIFDGGDVSLTEHVFLSYSSFEFVGENVCTRTVSVYGPEVNAVADENITFTATSASLAPTEVPVHVDEQCANQFEEFVSARSEIVTGTLSIDFTATGEAQRVPNRYGTTPGVSVYGGVSTRTPAEGRIVLDAGDVQLDTVTQEASISDVNRVLVQF